MKITDWSRAAESDKRELKRQIDRLPHTKTLMYDCELPPGCIPLKNISVFYRDGADYAMYMNEPFCYPGQNPALTALKDGEPVLFRDYPMLMRFFEELALAAAPEPSRWPSLPAAPVPDAADGYDIDRIANMSDIALPATSAPTVLDYRDIQRDLEKIVIGQSIATETVAYQAAMFLNKKNSKKPLSIMASGPPGTGKSEMAKALAKVLSKLGRRQYSEVWTDLNQFTEAHSVHKLIGSPPGYVGYSDTPTFEAVTRNPYTVFHWDETDKCHPDVLKLMMAILDEGRCTANKEQPDGSREYDFRNCIFIFTSNYQLDKPSRKRRIGFSFSEDVASIRHDESVDVSYTENGTEDGTDADITRRIYRSTEAARKAFVEAGNLKEIASRFNCFVQFHELSAEAKARILVKMVIEAGFEYDIRLAHISSSILQGLIDASASEEALTVRSFKAVIEGYLAAAFAEAGADYGGRAVRLEGTIDAPVIVPA